MIRIGLISDDSNLQPLLSSALGKHFGVILTPNETVKEISSPECCDVVLFDLDSNHPSISQRIEDARRIIGSGVAAVLMADDPLRSVAMELVSLGANGYCRRPPSIQELKTLLMRAHESRLLKRMHSPVEEALDTEDSCDRLMGSSPQMRQVYDLVRRVANINASVLVTGESGTGKELIANAIHNLGVRSVHPFVAVCCGAIPETLIESELFGHEKGAFTGSVGARAGYLEQAGEGTLLLDEIGELSLSTQVKLLRVLQQREYSRLGSNRLIPLRARVVFATHRDLTQMVAQGTFRQDLYYRINVIRIDVPPLQDHPEDIAQIANHFLQKYSDVYAKPVTSIDADAVNVMKAYAWPGNVRELENVIQRAIILSTGGTIRKMDLPIEIQEQDVLNIGRDVPSGSFEQQLRDYKLKLAISALRGNHGNKTLAARHLSISRAYLHRLIRLAEPDTLAISVMSDAQEERELGVA
jgi:DNA-binding NtrC family response regulator